MNNYEQYIFTLYKQFINITIANVKLYDAYGTGSLVSVHA